MPENPRIFVLDENVAIWSWTLRRVERVGNRYTTIPDSPSELRAIKLVVEIYGRGLGFGVSRELESRYNSHYQLLQESRVPRLGSSLLAVISDARARSQVRTVNPPERRLPLSIHDDDHYLVRLVAELKCYLVSEDSRLRAALLRSGLPTRLDFTVLSLDEALDTVANMPATT